MRLTVLPITHGRWADLEAVFKAKGCSVARGCWCMAYRRSGAEKPLAAGTSRAEANRADLKALVAAGKAPGLIAYRGKVPVGWVSLAPRKEFARLKRSPVMKPVDDKPVWSVVCFVVPSAHRGQGVAHALLRGAIAYARKRGAALIEAILWTKKVDPATTPCGSEPSPCTTTQASRKWRDANRCGLSFGSRVRGCAEKSDSN